MHLLEGSSGGPQGGGVSWQGPPPSGDRPAGRGGGSAPPPAGAGAQRGHTWTHRDRGAGGDTETRSQPWDTAFPLSYMSLLQYNSLIKT